MMDAKGADAEVIAPTSEEPIVILLVDDQKYQSLPPGQFHIR